MKKVVIYQINIASEVDILFGLEDFLYTNNINAKEFKIKVISGDDSEAFEDALEIVDYLGVKKLVKHNVLNKNHKYFNKDLNYFLSLLTLERYNIIFLVTYYDQVNQLSKLIANTFKKKQEINLKTMPGSIISIDLEKEDIRVYNPNSILN